MWKWLINTWTGGMELHLAWPPLLSHRCRLAITMLGIKLSFVQNVPLVSKLIKYHFVSTCTTKYHFQLIKKLFKSLNNHSSPLWFVLIVDIKIIKGNLNGPDGHIWITMDNGTLCAKDNLTSYNLLNKPWLLNLCRQNYATIFYCCMHWLQKYKVNYYNRGWLRQSWWQPWRRCPCWW